VNLPTGFGKTLIAARLIDHSLRVSPNKKIAFLVPTRPLVEQQSAYFKELCRLADGTTPPSIQCLVGLDQADWRESDWNDCLRRNHILVGTAALFQQGFVTSKFLAIQDFSLLVFDECHNAVGNSPMAGLLRDGVAPMAASGLYTPRVLGLTASFVNGSLRGIEEKRRSLEALMLSTIFCPNVASKFTDESFIHVDDWSCSHDLKTHQEAIAWHVEAAVKNVEPVKEITKLVRRCSHVFEELGFNALLYYIDNVIVKQVVEKATQLKDGDEACSRFANRLLHGLPALRSELNQLSQHLNSDQILTAKAEPTSPKLRRLIQILRELFSTKSNQSRGIIFVEQVALVSALSREISIAFRGAGIQCGAVAGVGYQNEKERKLQLDKFKNGESQILAATATLEEGIDVSTCEFVIRYTNIATTKAHIQGSGRARHPNAVIYYFENNPTLERRKEATLTSTAKDQSLSLNVEDFRKSMASMSIAVDQRHPYPFFGASSVRQNQDGLVSVFNCKQILNQYCSMALGASIQPKKTLYQYSNKPGDRKLLSKVRFPTPLGWRSLSEEDYKQFWTGVDRSQVLPADRVKNKAESDLEEMMFVYLVVVELREHGYLNCHNQLENNLKFETKSNCSLDSDWNMAIQFKNKVFQSERHTHG